MSDNGGVFDSWERCDSIFKPKRKVNNKSSNALPHIIGTFYSNKMNKCIEYESINEFILYSILELDKRTFKYYVQPVEIEIKYIDKDCIEKRWIHIPDVLVFRDNMKPILYQIKDPRSKITDKIEIINKKCNKYAEKNEWNYNVIYPKLLPTELIRNIRFLIGFLKRRKEYNDLIPNVMARLEHMRNTNINELINSFADEINTFILLPTIYHLIANGSIFTNIEMPISEFSNITIYREIDYFSYLKEVTSTENKQTKN